MFFLSFMALMMALSVNALKADVVLLLRDQHVG